MNLDRFACLIVLCYVLFFLLFGFCLYAESQTIDWGKLVTSIIQVESGGDPNAISNKGAIGLMQITPIVYREWQGEQQRMVFINIDKGYSKQLTDFIDLYDPDLNKQMGSWYLYRLKDHYLKKVKPIDHPFEYKTIIITVNTLKRGVYKHTKYIKCAKDYKVALILAGYNGGITRLRKHNYDISKMPYETRNYVKKVMKLYNKN